MDYGITLIITDITGKEFEFTTLNSLKTFIRDELKYWKSKQEKYSSHGGLFNNYIDTPLTIFEGLNNTIDSWKGSLKVWDDDTLQSNINSYISANPSNWISKSHSFINNWFEVFDKFGIGTANAFIYPLVAKALHSPTSVEGLQGSILAYEFILQNESTLTKRRDAEKKSISRVRNDLISSKDDLFNEVKEFKDDFHSWDEDTRKQAKRLYSANDYLIKKKAQKYENIWRKRVTELESTYEELLRLKKPAQYWKDQASNHSRSAWVFVGLIITVAILGCMGFGLLFWVWLNGEHTVEFNKFHSVQGVIIFIVIVSSYAFLIRTFSRLAFSSFHLQRDAEEREQLTHVYLALKNESDDMNQDARKIIFQALFSRADTGLLTGGSSPTMPGIHDLLKATSGK